MKILILEDDKAKLNEINLMINNISKTIATEVVTNNKDFIQKIERYKYDLIVMDLLVPYFDGEEAKDLSSHLISSVRDKDCKNSKTKVIALTKFQEKADNHYGSLNMNDINVITFSQTSGWEDVLARYIDEYLNFPQYDFVIICALEKEVLGFSQAGCHITESTPIRGLDCKDITIAGRTGVIVKCPRMGLVDAAITSSRAIEIFQPQIICMSGICAGVKGEVDIYDLVIPEICYQHDSGKWTLDGLVGEPYSVPLDYDLSIKLKSIVVMDSFKDSIMKGLKIKRSQIPQDLEEISISTKLGVASSGSTVVADETMNSNVSNQHRKVIAFDMENYAVYEAARLASSSPIFFSIKSVVDNGNILKNDSYQELACTIAAKATVNIIESLLN
ncbi:phosphorylase family protein [Psychrobacter immobilis]|uniref:phosphorylase family protein n=1 Tax=Psychrobacter immobilis TaxID=498 RepID=UPI003FD1EF7F